VALGYRLSVRARTDLLEIARFTERTWGAAQSIRYIGDLEACCVLLAAHPQAGRLYDRDYAGRCRMERGSHVIFYREDEAGIFVQRVLHKSMVPEFHQLEP
jgi:toxin ParE1/3/4